MAMAIPFTTHLQFGAGNRTGDTWTSALYAVSMAAMRARRPFAGGVGPAEAPAKPAKQQKQLAKMEQAAPHYCSWHHACGL